MTKYIPEQPRVTGTFTISINGRPTAFRVGQNFEDTAALLSALDGAGIEYTDPVYSSTDGEATGRIKVTSVDTRILLQINGQPISHIYGNVFFTPTAAELNCIQNSNYAYELEYSAPPSGAEIGEQIFPTPTFSDSTGAIDLGGWTISGGVMACDDDSVATFEPLSDLVEGIYSISVTETALTHRGVSVSLAGDSGNIQSIAWVGATTAGACTVVVDEVISQEIRISCGDGVPVSLTAFTVTRTS